MKKTILISIAVLLSAVTNAQRANGIVTSVLSDVSGIVITKDGNKIKYNDPLASIKGIAVGGYVSFSVSVLAGEATASGLNIILSEPALVQTACSDFWIPVGTESEYINTSTSILHYPMGWYLIEPDGFGGQRAYTSSCVECKCYSNSGGCSAWQTGTRWGCTAENGCTSCCGTNSVAFSDGATVSDYTVLSTGILLDLEGGIQPVIKREALETEDGTDILVGYDKALVDWKSLPGPPDGLFSLPQVKKAMETWDHAFYGNEIPTFIKNGTQAPCENYSYVSVYFFGYKAAFAMPRKNGLLPMMAVSGGATSCECNGNVSANTSGHCTLKTEGSMNRCVPDSNCKGCDLCVGIQAGGSRDCK